MSAPLTAPSFMDDVKAEINTLHARLKLLESLQPCDFERVFEMQEHEYEMYKCRRCGQWTANIEGFKDSVCDVVREPKP